MKGYWGDEFLEEVRGKSDIADVISDYVRLKKTGSRLYGLCPFHAEKTPSFSVSVEKQLFYCFGCQASGDVFSFIMRKEGLDFPQAVEFLARRAGLSLPVRREGDQAAWKEPVYRALDQAARYYHWILLNSPSAQRARDYLSRREVSQGSIVQFQLGFAPPVRDGLLRSLLRKGFSVESLLEAGLIMKAAEDSLANTGPSPEGSNYYDRFRGRIMFPIQDHRGQVIGFGGRVLDDSQPKYLNSPEGKIFKKGNNWYGLAQARAGIRQTGQAIVMEGYLDVLMAHQFGFRNAVASLGTALTREQAHSLSTLAEEIIFSYDSDAAGFSATQRGIEILRELGSRVRIIEIPEGKDPDEFLRKKGPQEFRRLLTEAVPVMEYRMEQALRNLDRSNPRSRLEATQRVILILRAIEDPVEAQVFLEMAAIRLGVPEETIRFQVKKQGLPRKKRENWDRTGKKGHNTNRDEVENNGYDGRVKTEREILKLLLQRPELREQGRSQLEKEDFSDESCQLLFQKLSFSQDSTSQDSWFAPGDSQDRSLLELVSRLSLETISYDQPARALKALIGALKENRRRQRLLEIEKRINEAGGVLDPELVQEFHQLMSRSKGSQAKGIDPSGPPWVS
ncbi:MAG: DNA primase [Firmicutes bacterium]|nr:DNA primase [Bacillota bacterium]MCL5039399.1 DNA primase [Bacillota bacterium]